MFQGQHEAAMHAFRHALELHERAFGEEHEQTLTTMNNYGIALHRPGETDAAGDMLQRALAISREVYGSDHPDTFFLV